MAPILSFFAEIVGVAREGPPNGWARITSLYQLRRVYDLCGLRCQMPRLVVRASVSGCSWLSPSEGFGKVNRTMKAACLHADAVLDWTDGVGVDVVIDNVGGSVFEDNLRALRLGGVFVNFGLVGGMKATLDFRDLFFRQHQLRGSFMGSMDEFKRGLAWLAEGKIRALWIGLIL